VILARPVSGLLLLMGLLTGTFGELSTKPIPRRGAGYWILAADFHVHAFPGDGALAPWALRHEVERAGLDVFTISNHNRVSTARSAQWLAERSEGPIVIVGQEITARGYHMIAAGIKERVNWETPAAAAIRAVHAQGGVAIAAHPARQYWPGWDDEAVATLDGYERAHPSMDWNEHNKTDFASFEHRAVARNPRIATIGSSDFHWNGAPGWCRTYLLARERTEAGVLDAVRAGRTVAADAHGHLYGDSQLVTIVEAAGGFVPPPETDRWRTLSIVSAWLGLLGLLVLGRQPTRGQPSLTRVDERLTMLQSP
jgi:hypothetical protein